jgi:hypothetical protein
MGLSFVDLNDRVAGAKRSVPRRASVSRGTPFGLCPGHPSSQVLRLDMNFRISPQAHRTIARMTAFRFAAK